MEGIIDLKGPSQGSTKSSVFKMPSAWNIGHGFWFGNKLFCQATSIDAVGLMLRLIYTQNAVEILLPGQSIDVILTCNDIWFHKFINSSTQQQSQIRTSAHIICVQDLLDIWAFYLFLLKICLVYCTHTCCWCTDSTSCSTSSSINDPSHSSLF